MDYTRSTMIFLLSANLDAILKSDMIAEMVIQMRTKKNIGSMTSDIFWNQLIVENLCDF